MLEASRLWVYPFGINGVTTQLSVYELDPLSHAMDCVPGLIGPDEMSAWDGKLDFSNGTYEACGRT